MFSEALKDLIAIRKPIIWVRTHEEKEAFIAIKNAIDSIGEFDNLFTWSHSGGVKQVKANKDKLIYETVAGVGIDRLTGKILEEQKEDVLETSVFILNDFHLITNNPASIRGLRDILEVRMNKYCPIIIVSPSNEIPFEFEKLAALIEYEDPTEEEILALIKTYESMSKMTIDNKERLSKLFVGFSRKEIIDTISMSIIKTGSVDEREISRKKIDVIKRTGVLDYKEPSASLDEVGGNEFFKKWIEEVEYCMMDDASQFGVAKPKGHLSLGIPGTSKSYTAEALAGKWKVPFLKLDMSRILSKYAGESERNMSKAIELIKSCSPCVLLIDEVEKALGGIKSSNASDSGVIARAFGKILEFLNDNDNGVYVIMTSNDVSQLPPELTRAGRLDAIWYFGLPDEKEREEIFKVHFAKVNQEVSTPVLKAAVEETKNYTGAEIEQIVKATVKKAFIRMKKNNVAMAITKEDIIGAKDQVVPISRSSKEKINQLELWAKGRALYASKREKKVKLNIDTDII